MNDCHPLRKVEQHSENKMPVLVMLYRFGYETKTGVARILGSFQYRPMFSHINGKLSLRPFE